MQIYRFSKITDSLIFQTIKAPADNHLRGSYPEEFKLLNYRQKHWNKRAQCDTVDYFLIWFSMLFCWPKLSPNASFIRIGILIFYVENEFSKFSLVIRFQQK